MHEKLIRARSAEASTRTNVRGSERAYVFSPRREKYTVRASQQATHRENRYIALVDPTI